MRTLFTNGKIYLERNTFAEAMLIDNKTIKKVGSNLELIPYIIDSNVVDLQGKTVLPGFNDSHLHLYGTACFKEAINLYSVTSIAEIIARSKEFITEHPEDTGPLIGRGWNQDFFTDDNRLPNRFDLDKISEDRSIMFPRACGHIVALNSQALRSAHIDRHTVAPDGGAIDVDTDGEPTGILRENALGLIESLYPDTTEEVMLRRLRTIAKHANALGITSVQTNDLTFDDNNTSRLEEAYRRFATDEVLKVNHQICYDDLDTFKQHITEGINLSTNPYNRYGCLKLFADGSLGARTAALRKPYTDDPATSGIAILSPEALDSWIQTASEAGIQVAIHAIGDRSIRDVLDAYTKVNKGSNKLRHGIIHCQITDKELLEKFKEQDILAYIQPIFLHYDLHIVENRVGKELADTSYAFKTMEEMHLHTSYGSDAPVEDFNPFHNLYCAITRKDLTGFPEDGYNPIERVDLETAIDAYTIGSAYASFDELHKGRLFAGYDADLIVLDQAIFEIDPNDIRNVTVAMTMVDGKIVYEK